MSESREIDGAIHDLCETVSFRELCETGIGRDLGLLSQEQEYFLVPPFFANQLAYQFSWWSSAFYGRQDSAIRVAPVAIRSIPGASVLGTGAVSRLPDGRLIDTWLAYLGDDAFTGPLRRADGGLWVRRDPPEPVQPGTYVLGHIGGDQNYAHWITCTLPLWRQFARKLRGSGVKLVVGMLTRFHREALEAFGIGADDIFIMPDREVRFERLVVISPISLWEVPRMTVEAARDLRERVIFGEEAAAPRRLFVSRGDTDARRLINEAEIEAALVADGFETIRCGELALAEQVRRFAVAEIVVGTHGAGLANIAFCKPGTHVVEIFPEYCVQPAFRAMAAAGGLRHGYVIGTSLESERSRLENNSWSQPFLVSVPVVRDAVRAAIERLGSDRPDAEIRRTPDYENGQIS